MRLDFSLVYLSIRSLMVAFSIESVAAPRQNKPPVPASARIHFILEKREYFFGESLVGQFVVENVGPTPFSIDHGGDYRGVSRALRFHVTATDELGNEVIDPGPLGDCFGGLGGDFDLLPGQKHIEKLPLLRYLRFDKPGIYTVRVKHDLGWALFDERQPQPDADGWIAMPVLTLAEQRLQRRRGLQKHPYGEVTIRLTPPTPEQAQRRLYELYAREGDELDFDVLRDPAYLPPLRERARRGDRWALAGIAGIATPEATHTLLRLADIALNKYELAVLDAIVDRLPYPEPAPRSLRQHIIFGWDRPEQRNWLVQKSWRPEFRPALCDLAARLLETDDDTRQRCGAYILACVAQQDALPVLLRGLQRECTHVGEVSPERGFNRRDFLEAADAMLRRGIDPARVPGSAAERIMFARALGLCKDFRPVNWLTTYEAILRDTSPWVRRVGLDSVPEDAGKETLDLIPPIAKDADAEVRLAACRAMGRLKAPEFREPLLEILTTTRDHALLCESSAAVRDLAPVQRLRVLVQRLGEKDMSITCLYQLMSVLKGRPFYEFSGELNEAEASVCKRAWERFIRDHEGELARGRTYAQDDPALPLRELFPKTSR